MLCVILLMEGLKNLLLYSVSPNLVMLMLQTLNSLFKILYNSYVFVITTFDNNMIRASEAGEEKMLSVLNDTMTPFLAKIGFSWQLGWSAVVAGFTNNVTDEARLEEYYIGMYRLLMNITVKVFEVSSYCRID
jgi:hypothetical protein